MHKTINSAINTDEYTKIGNRTDFTGNNVTLLMCCREFVPWVGATLLHTKGNSTTLRVHIQHHNFYFVADMADFSGVDVFVSPVHFGKVNKTFNTFFEFNKGTVICKVCDLTENTGSHRIAADQIQPWIITQLLQTKGNTTAFLVKLEYPCFNFIADIQHFRWVLDSLPCKIGDMQQSVQTAQINECTVICKVLDDTFNHLTFFQGIKQFFSFFRKFIFNNGSARNNDVVFRLVQFDDFEIQFTAFDIS